MNDFAEIGGAEGAGGVELNLDGLVGPSHNYAGLSPGNFASTRNQNKISNPRQAALEGLGKMKLCYELGVPQAILPPQRRPPPGIIKELGFSGGFAKNIEAIYKTSPALLARLYSASAMWCANAATVSGAGDTGDGRTHFSVANLTSNFHRSLETDFTNALLRLIFNDPGSFVHHGPLPASLPDEGAANHTRLGISHQAPGLNIFVYGQESFDGPGNAPPGRYPARQSLEASLLIARRHGLDPKSAFFIRQSRQAINAGVFHNDVIATGALNFFMYHEDAYENGDASIQAIEKTFLRLYNGKLYSLKIPRTRLSLEDAVATYLFNSQILTLPEGGMVIIAPVECRQNPVVAELLEEIIQAENPVRRVIYINLRQSMSNGGGPACLRLRIPLPVNYQKNLHPGVLFDLELYEKLANSIRKHYRDKLAPEDLRDPALGPELNLALDDIGKILSPGNIYDFESIPGKV